MPPRCTSAGKHPKITTAFAESATGSTKKKKRTICESSESESEDDAEPLTPAQGRGRPRGKDKEPEPPLYDKVNYPRNAFSLCVEKKGSHMPLVWFNQASDYLDAKSELFDASTEIGPKAGNLHMQCIFEAHMLDDENSYKRFKTELKSVMNVRWGDGSKCAIYIKVLQAGQTVIRMIGYVRQDRLLTTFKNRNKNVTEAMIAQGIEEHTSLKMCYTDGKIVLTKANLFSKAYNKWAGSIAPRKLLFSQMMCDMLNDGAHVSPLHD